MGAQHCPGPCANGTLTELASETSRGKWAHSEGVRWEWRTSDVQHAKCAWCGYGGRAGSRLQELGVLPKKASVSHQ